MSTILNANLYLVLINNILCLFYECPERFRINYSIMTIDRSHIRCRRVSVAFDRVAVRSTTSRPCWTGSCPSWASVRWRILPTPMWGSDHLPGATRRRKFPADRQTVPIPGVPIPTRPLWRELESRSPFLLHRARDRQTDLWPVHCAPIGPPAVVLIRLVRPAKGPSKLAIRFASTSSALHPGNNAHYYRWLHDYRLRVMTRLFIFTQLSTEQWQIIVTSNFGKTLFKCIPNKILNRLSKNYPEYFWKELFG